MRGIGRRVLFRLFLLVVALLPFELPVSEGLHGKLKPLIGEAYMLLFCGSLVIFASIIYLWWQGRPLRNGWQQYSLYALLFSVPGLLAVAVSATVSSGYVQPSIQQLVFGYIAPVFFCLAFFAMTEEERRQAWLAFYTGWCLFLAGSFIFLADAWPKVVGFAGLNMGTKLFLWRSKFYDSWNLYPIYIGNANKTSNYILIFLLFSSVLIGRDRVMRSGLARMVYFSYWILSIITLLLLFSRAALMLLPLVFLASGIWKTLGKKAKWALVSALGVAAIIGYASFGAALTYLLTTQSMYQPDVDVLGTFGQRFEQWDQIYSYLQTHSSALFVGLGSGGYGDIFFGDFVRGTHNMFLDNLMESGIFGLLALVLVLLLAFLHCFGFHRFHLRNRTALIALVILVMLMFREHSVAYLYVTSLGGLCFTVIFYWLCCRDEEGKSAGIQPQSA
jgi:O-antigen ligase